MRPNIHLKVAGALDSPSPNLHDCADVFDAVYASIQQRLLSDATSSFGLPSNHAEYLRFLMDATCRGGKRIRGLAVVRVVDAMTASLTTSARRQALEEAAVCGWMIEFMQGHFLIEDDIMDSSVTRRGQPCWYRRPGVTVPCAINDGLIVMAWCTAMAYQFLTPREHAAEVVRCLHECHYTTTIGQHYDVTAMLDPRRWHPDMDLPKGFSLAQFTADNYRRVVVHKTACYTFHLPLVLGVTVASRWLYRRFDLGPLRPLALAMGEYFQALDDFLDCFADPQVIGKVGTDIEDAKCSWLAVSFLERATVAQNESFAASYGRSDPEAVAVVKDLYRDAKLQDVFQKYEQDMSAKVDTLLGDVDAVSPSLGAVCKAIWLTTYQRKR